MTWKPATGYCAVRDVTTASKLIWTPEGKPREVRTHRGVIVALGDMPRTVTGARVPWEVRVGDVVQFHYNYHQGNRELDWPDTGESVVMLVADELDLVIEEVWSQATN